MTRRVISVVCLLVLVCGAPALDTFASPLVYRVYIPHYVHNVNAKKGVGMRWPMCDELRALNVSWFYAWGNDWCTDDGREFVDMLYSEFSDAAIGRVLLGPNEIDNAGQANLTPEQVAAMWRLIETQYPDRYLVSPVSNSGTFAVFDFIDAYRARYLRYPRLDAIAIHYYVPWNGGMTLQQYASQVRGRAAAYGYDVPLWVTEFGACYVSDNDMAALMTEWVQWMQATPWIERYAYYAMRVPESECWAQYDLFNGDGSPTRFGELYQRLP